jgi:hypothetical protein
MTAPPALPALWEEPHGRLLNFIRARIQDPQKAKDIPQEVFLIDQINFRQGVIKRRCIHLRLQEFGARAGTDRVRTTAGTNRSSQPNALEDR